MRMQKIVNKFGIRIEWESHNNVVVIIIIIIIWFVRQLALRPLLAYCASLG
jgi:vacuolar-type H+-ATPase subunit I/STV1